MDFPHDIPFIVNFLPKTNRNFQRINLLQVKCSPTEPTCNFQSINPPTRIGFFPRMEFRLVLFSICQVNYPSRFFTRHQLARINHHISSNFEFVLKTPPRINFQTSFALHRQLTTVKSRFFRFGKAQEAIFDCLSARGFLRSLSIRFQRAFRRCFFYPGLGEAHLSKR